MNWICMNIEIHTLSQMDDWLSDEAVNSKNCKSVFHHVQNFIKGYVKGGTQEMQKSNVDQTIILYCFIKVHETLQLPC